MTGVLGDSSARKHAFLRQMGVDVWLPRTGPLEPLAELSAGLAAPAETETAEQRSDSAGTEPAAPVPPARVRQPVPSAPTDRETTGRTGSGAALAPFSVLCLSKGPALMLVEPGQSKAARRFCLDVLAAASGLYGGESVQVVFNWPQPGVENDLLSAKKALGAFVAKQLGDQAPELVLVDAISAERLESLPEGSLLLAPVPELMVDAAKKRTLWLELEGRR